MDSPFEYEQDLWGLQKGQELNIKQCLLIERALSNNVLIIDMFCTQNKDNVTL